MKTHEDFARPPEGSLFSPVDSPLGMRLALVFGNEGKNGSCPFHGQQCLHCDIGAGEGVAFTPEMNAARLDFFRDHYHDVFPKLGHLVVYNYGSTFNDNEFSASTRRKIMDFTDALPLLRRISFDSREHFVTAERVSEMVALLRDSQRLSVTLGLESQSDEIRQKNLQKKMTRARIDDVFAALASRREKTAVEINVLFQPPGVTGPDAIEEAVKTIEFGLELMDKWKVLADFNFHPYYPSRKGMKAFPDHPRAMLEHAICALIRINRIIRKHGGGSSLFVGWNDEGHDLQPAVKKIKQLLYDPAFAAFNRSQEESDLHI
jgi:hypothetical protein